MMLSRLPYHDSLKLLEADIHHANALYVSFFLLIIIHSFLFIYIYLIKFQNYQQKSVLSSKGSSSCLIVFY
jgi:hypothetical protein